MLQIDDVENFKLWILDGSDRCCAAVQDLNLLDWSADLQQHEFNDSLFLGCEIDVKTAGHITTSGGIVIPDLDEFHFAVHRAHLYSPDDLFQGFDADCADGYHKTYDYSVYQQYVEHGKRSTKIHISLARSLHDHSITDALDEFIEGRKVVAIMGGHGMERRDPIYTQIARIARTLTQSGFLVATGGGPGAMEAAHLGAYFATRDESQLAEAIDILKVRPTDAEPGKEYSDRDWLHRAMKVREQFPIPESDLAASASVGIPTWFYGHEPPAAFATHIAKYFANSIREDGLLEIARHGIVFSPGSAGTIQEIFQDAAQNHYATVGVVSPMILYGVEHWTNKRPVWSLLSAVSHGQKYGELVALTDDPDEVIQRLRTFDPKQYGG